MPGTRPGMTKLKASRRPGMTTSSDRLMHGHKLGAVGKRRFDLDVVDHLGDPIHALRTGDDLRAGLHQFGHGAAVARALDDEIGNDRDGFRMVELDAALQPPSRHHRRHRDQKLVLFAGRQIHASTLIILKDLTEPKPNRAKAAAAPNQRRGRAPPSYRHEAWPHLGHRSAPLQTHSSRRSRPRRRTTLTIRKAAPPAPRRRARSAPCRWPRRKKQLEAWKRSEER